MAVQTSCNFSHATTATLGVSVACKLSHLSQRAVVSVWFQICARHGECGHQVEDLANLHKLRGD